MLSRLPITLAQLKAEDNSEKLKNEMIHLLYYLYHSKKKQKKKNPKKQNKIIYSGLINTI